MRSKYWTTSLRNSDKFRCPRFTSGRDQSFAVPRYLWSGSLLYRETAEWCGQSQQGRGAEISRPCPPSEPVLLLYSLLDTKWIPIHAHFCCRCSDFRVPGTASTHNKALSFFMLMRAFHFSPESDPSIDRVFFRPTVFIPMAGERSE